MRRGKYEAPPGQILLGAAIITRLANQREASEPAGARGIGEHRAASTGQYYKACASATFSDGQKIVFRCTCLVAGG